MDRALFDRIEHFMKECMMDSAHDQAHVYRVLYLALEIASYEARVNLDILIPACLLHDIGREAQYKNPKVCHAQVGAEMARDFCAQQGIPDDAANHIAKCVLTHRYRSDNPPESIEAKILFDADKLDVTGTLGIARTLFYNGHVGHPLYHTDGDGNVLDGANDRRPSFLQEYQSKLKNVYDKFYTRHAWEIGERRRRAATRFYENMLSELSETYQKGRELLREVLR